MESTFHRVTKTPVKTSTVSRVESVFPHGTTKKQRHTQEGMKVKDPVKQLSLEQIIQFH